MPMQTPRVGSFPHQMYVAVCDCVGATEEPTLNYAGHKVGPPKCSACKKTYQLDEALAGHAPEGKKV